MKPYILILVLIFTAFITGCGKQEYQRVAVDDEAEKQANLFWAESFSKCGDDYFGIYSKDGRSLDGAITQVKAPRFFTNHKMNDVVFTEADRLNGFEWKGYTSLLYAKASRYFVNGKWSEWLNDDNALDYESINFDIRKMKNTWEFKNDSNSRYLSIPCDKVPKEN